MEWHKEQGRGDVSRGQCLKDIRVIFNRAIEWGYFTGENPTRFEKKPKRKLKKATTLDEKGLESLLNATSGWIRLAVILAGYQGLRHHEIAQLKHSMIDRKARLIRLTEAEGYSLKTGARDIPCSDLLLAELPEGDGYIFPARSRIKKQESRYRAANYSATIRSKLKQLNLPSAKPWQLLRVSFGNILYRNGVSLDLVAEFMGNSVATLKAWYIGSTPYTDKINIHKSSST